MSRVAEKSEAYVDRAFHQTEIGVLPVDWQVTSLAHIARVDVGFAFKSQWFEEAADVALLRGENVGYGRIDWSDRKSLSSRFAFKFREYELASGDIVIGMDRTFTKSGTKISRVRAQDCPALLVQRVGKFVSLNCDPNFLWSLLSSPKYQSALVLQQKGMDIPHLSRNEIVAPLVALPPTLAEQEAIASALSDADALIESLEQLLAKKRQIKQGAMQELLTCKRRLPGFDGEWVSVPLDAFAIVEMGHSPPGSSYNDVGLGTPLINGPTEFTKRHPVKKQWTTDPTRLCRAGDVLLCVRGSSTGRTNISNDTYCIGRGVCSIRSRENASGLYLEAVMPDIVNEILDLSAGSTFPSIDGKSIRSIECLLPPLDEQLAIAEMLAEMESQIDAIERRLTKARQLKQAMMQQLLTGRIRLV